jgi:hypothetical protein
LTGVSCNEGSIHIKFAENIKKGDQGLLEVFSQRIKKLDLSTVYFSCWLKEKEEKVVVLCYCFTLVWV